jgi:hypothetical protein
MILLITFSLPDDALIDSDIPSLIHATANVHLLLTLSRCQTDCGIYELGTNKQRYVLFTSGRSPMHD